MFSVAAGVRNRVHEVISTKTSVSCVVGRSRGQDTILGLISAITHSSSCCSSWHGNLSHEEIKSLLWFSGFGGSKATLVPLFDRATESAEAIVCLLEGISSSLNSCGLGSLECINKFSGDWFVEVSDGTGGSPVVLQRLSSRGNWRDNSTVVKLSVSINNAVTLSFLRRGGTFLLTVVREVDGYTTVGEVLASTGQAIDIVQTVTAER